MTADVSGGSDSDAPVGSDSDAPVGSDSDAPVQPESGVPHRPYVESPIIMATVRVVSPFVFVFGLFIMFHGADSAGGGFQGGVIVSTVILMLGIAFGIEPTRDWLNPRVLISVIGVGVGVFLAVGFGSVLLGGAFLDYSAYGFDHAATYGVELVELAIGVIVAGIVVGLFFGIASGNAKNTTDAVDAEGAR